MKGKRNIKMNVETVSPSAPMEHKAEATMSEFIRVRREHNEGFHQTTAPRVRAHNEAN